jgi:formylglycine-generating enzyme required for sulfatase activity
LDASLREFQSVLREYPDDRTALARTDELRSAVARQDRQAQAAREVDKLLAARDFRGAAELVRATERQGTDAAWATGLHQRVRAAWRQSAAAVPSDEGRLRELEGLLKEYGADSDAQALAGQLRKKLADRELDLGGGVRLRLVAIDVPSGGRTFRMGSPDTEPLRTAFEGPWEMTLSRGYLLGETEVTVGQFRQFVEATGHATEALGQSPPLNWEDPGLRERQTDEHPVVGVTWSDAAAFCKWLSAKTGRTCRLPTEAEWEYACRAGGETPFAFGDKLSPKDANFDSSMESELLAAGGPPRRSTVAVRQYRPNAWGLYDLHGNAAEWCADPYRDRPQPPGGDATGGAAEFRVARGGSWQAPAEECRSAYRWKRKGSVGSAAIGFRVCVEP